MTRISECGGQTLVPRFPTEPLVQPKSDQCRPCSDPEVKSKAAQVLDDLMTRTGGRDAAKAKHSSMNTNKELAGLLNDVAGKLATTFGAEVLARYEAGALLSAVGNKVPSGVAFGFDRIASIAMPVASVWSLLSGLSRIGNTHLEAKAAGRQDALHRGFAETLGLAIDRPRLGATALEAAAKGSKHVDRFSSLARQPKASEGNRAHFRSLADKYVEGSALALKIVNQLSTDDRRELACLLSRELPAGPTSSDRLLGLFHLNAN